MIFYESCFSKIAEYILFISMKTAYFFLTKRQRNNILLIKEKVEKKKRNLERMLCYMLKKPTFH